MFTLSLQGKEEIARSTAVYLNHLDNSCAARRSKLSFPKQFGADEASSSHTVLSRRCDVVYKTILRDFRRFYQTEFNNLTGFSKKKRFRDKTYFVKMMQGYVEELAEKESTPFNKIEILFVLGGLVY